jgi:hypothetical protein
LRGEILVATSDRGGVLLDASLTPKGTLTGFPVPGSDGEPCVVALPEASGFDGNAIRCAAKLAADTKRLPKSAEDALFVPPSARYDAIAVFDSVAKDGSIAEVMATREPGGKLRVRRRDPGAAKPFDTTLESIGVPIALLDLNLDGIPELVTTTETEPDTLVVSSVFRTQVSARLRWPAPGGVRALGVCPPEERGVPALVAVVGQEVWLVRAGETR